MDPVTYGWEQPRPEAVCVQQRDGTFRVYLPDGRVLTALDQDHARRLVFTFAIGARLRWEQGTA